MSNLAFRINVIGIFFTVVGTLIVWQMGRIQGDELAAGVAKVNDQQNSISREWVYPERGNIYDRWGRLLAGNKTVYELGINLVAVQNAQTIAETVASIPELDYGYANVFEWASMEYKKGEAENISLSSSVEPDVINRLDEIQSNYENETFKVRRGEIEPSLAGLHWKARLQRSYPEKEMASNILGFYQFLDRELGLAAYGVEEQYDELLSGEPMNVIIPLDPNEVYEVPAVPPGDSLILTIDREIQATVERIIDGAVEQNGAASGTAIVMDPRNGEILAMVSTPRMDLNQYWLLGEVFPGNMAFNRAVGETYEPGSIFKILTMAAALDMGVVTPDTIYTDNGYYQWKGATIYNWDRRAWGEQTMTGCMQHSLNVCLAWVSTEKIELTDFYSYLRAFGIDRRTNIDLADEVNTPLSVPGDSNWYPVNLGTNAYGQGLAVTPIQITMAAAAVANGGRMMAPHILRAVISNGRQYNTSSQIVSQPIKAETAATLNEMLVVSLEKEASTALVPGYRVAGKTGTAQIPVPGGYHDVLTNASFIGWGPADDPRFVVYIWLEKPISSPWASEVVAPVFSEIVQHLVVLLNSYRPTICGSNWSDEDYSC